MLMREAVADHLKVQFAHPLNADYAAVRIGLDSNGLIVGSHFV
jgi:hypothetical protein